MKKFLLPVYVLAVALLAGADDKPKDDTAEKLKGTWKLVKAEAGGKDVTAGLGEHTWTFDGEKVTAQDKSQTHKGTYQLDATKKPVHLDVNGRDFIEKTGVWRLIVQVEGDTLKVAFVDNPDDRAKGFDDKDAIITTFKRVKK